MVERIVKRKRLEKCSGGKLQSTVCQVYQYVRFDFHRSLGSGPGRAGAFGVGARAPFPGSGWQSSLTVYGNFPNRLICKRTCMIDESGFHRAL